MNNFRIKRQLDQAVKDAIAYWEMEGTRYGKMYGFDCPTILFYNTEFDHPYDSDILNEVRYNVDDSMATVLTACGDNDEMVAIDDRIVTSICAQTFMSYERFYSLVLSCELNFESVERCLQFTMRHELGHIIDAQLTLVGKPVSYWNLHDEQVQLESTLMPKLRKNASVASCLNWFRKYFSIPSEKAANDAVSITEEDILDYFRRTSGNW